MWKDAGNVYIRIDIGTKHLIASAGPCYSSAAADVVRPRLGYMLDKLITLDVTIECYRNPPTVNYFKRFSTLDALYLIGQSLTEQPFSRTRNVRRCLYRSPAPSSGYVKSVALSHGVRIVILLGIINSLKFLGDSQYQLFLCVIENIFHWHYQHKWPMCWASDEADEW